MELKVKRIILNSQSGTGELAQKAEHMFCMQETQVQSPGPMGQPSSTKPEVGVVSEYCQVCCTLYFPVSSLPKYYYNNGVKVYGQSYKQNPLGFIYEQNSKF